MKKSEDRVRDGPASGEDFTCLGLWAISGTTLQGRNHEKAAIHHTEWDHEHGLAWPLTRNAGRAI